jgi:hypothetical protein
MELPSFLWLWRIAAWSMGLSLLAYVILAISGSWMFLRRRDRQPRPNWLRPFHFFIGCTMVLLVLLLLGIGLVGTVGHYGNLGHSVHLPAGLLAVSLTLLSAWSATQINREPWARSLPVGTNMVLFWGFVFVSLSGWTVVQKYLP